MSTTGQPSARLLDGTTLPADLLVCGTGFRQPAPFLPPAVLAQCTDSDGNWLLHRNIQPIGVPHLSFVGYSSSLFCPLTSEMAALWVAARLEGWIILPSEEEQRRGAENKLAFLQAHTTHHAHGTSVVPWSMHTVDELLGDMGSSISSLATAKEWLLPVDPIAYSPVVKDLLSRKVLQKRTL